MYKYKCTEHLNYRKESYKASEKVSEANLTLVVTCVMNKFAALVNKHNQEIKNNVPSAQTSVWKQIRTSEYVF